MQVQPILADIGDSFTAIAAIFGVLLFLWTWIGRPVRREWRTNRTFQRQFREDWMGEPDRPGVPGRIGVMQSLQEIRADWVLLSGKVRHLERELLKVRAQVTHLLTFRCPEHTPPSPETEEG